MKIKYLLFSFLIGTSLYGQTEKTCEERLSDFELFYKNDFTYNTMKGDEGRNAIIDKINTILEKCPSYNSKIYTLSEEMLSEIVQKMNLGEERNIWANHLISLYDKQSTRFPETKRKNSIKKILTLYESKVKSNSEILTLFEQIYTKDKEIFSAQALLVYTDLLVAQNTGKIELSKDYIKRTDELNGQIQSEISSLKSKIENADDTQKNEIKNSITSLNLASKNIQSSLKNVKMDCNTWVEFYKEDFDKNKSDVYWLENTAEKLSKFRCSDNDFFENVAQTYYNLKKTPKSAFYLGNIAQQQKDLKKAQAYFNESADLETDKSEKAKLYYRIADLQRTTDKAQAKTNLEKAIENNPEMLEAYIVLSQLYANATDCTENEFEQKALNLLAARNIEKLMVISPKYETVAKKLIEEYLAKAPTKDEVKKAKMKGKTVTFGGWINQSVIIK